MLLGGVPGVVRAKVVILGGGVVGTNAATWRSAWAPTSSVLDRNNECCARCAGSSAVRSTRCSRRSDAIEEHVTSADLVIGGVLMPGAAAPKLVTAAMVKQMKKGSVIVDVAIDQGGCFETSHATTHADPDLRRRRRRPLLRRQHAGRRGAHVDLRAQQRDAAVRAGARRQGLEARARRRPAICATASTSPSARSRASRSRRRWATRTSRRNR